MTENTISNLDKWLESDTKQILSKNIFMKGINNCDHSDVADILATKFSLDRNNCMRDIEYLRKAFSEVESVYKYSNETHAYLGIQRHEPSLVEPKWVCSYYDLPDLNLPDGVYRAGLKKLLAGVVKHFYRNTGTVDDALVAMAIEYVSGMFWNQIKFIQNLSYGVTVCCTARVVDYHSEPSCVVSFGKKY